MTQVAVCGPATCSPEEATWAHQVGALLAERGVVVLCGGGTGVMAAAASGARSAGGVVIGVLPDDGPPLADVTAYLATGMGEGRNAVLVRSADAVIAIGGSWGTLSEIALALRRATIPVIVLGGWQLPASSPHLFPATSPAQAVSLALP
ncbi:TIGR00725 family protein [Actinoplanes sp. GCM10030250]|uniref:TIGR00725 family protein n=1 Tax=Actinoplanes sp. GCM10030250 TaxID=3273376 RepID=UPI003615D697